MDLRTLSLCEEYALVRFHWVNVGIAAHTVLIALNLDASKPYYKITNNLAPPQSKGLILRYLATIVKSAV